jgi:hypothetical protein
MLTASQLVAIATGNSNPPYRLSSLSKLYAMKPLSLRSVSNLMERQNCYVVCEIRDPAILKGVKTYSQLQDAFLKSGTPSKATLVKFSEILQKEGASIKYLSEDWRRVGIQGTLGGSLAGLHAYLIENPATAPNARDGAGRLQPEDLASNLSTISDGIIAFGGILLAVGLVGVTAGAAVPLIAVVGGGIAGFGAGVKIGIGISGFISDSNSAPLVVSLPSGNVNLPINSEDAGSAIVTNATTGSVSDIASTPAVDPSGLPANPPSEDDPGNPGAGDPGTQGKEDGKDGEKDEKDGKDGKDGEKDEKDGKDGEKDEKDGKDGEKDDKDGKDGEKDQTDGKDGKDGEKDDKDGKDGEKDDDDGDNLAGHVGDGEARGQAVGLTATTRNTHPVSRQLPLWDRFSV